MLDSSPQLSTVIDAGVRVHILCGDAYAPAIPRTDAILKGFWP